MPVPRRRQSKGVVTLRKLPSLALKILDINLIFQKTKTLLLWGWTPIVLYIGMNTEPRPSWIDLINIWD